MRTSILILTLLVTTGTASAQLGSYGNVPNPYATQLYYDAFGHGRRDANRSKDAPAPAHRSLTESDFKRANGRLVLEEFLATAGLEGDQAIQLRNALETKLATLESRARKNNVAAAMGVLFASAYRVVNNIQINDASRDAVIAYVNDALAVQASFKKLPAKGRQETADTALVQAALIELLVEANDPVMLKAGVTGARTALRNLTGSEDGGFESNRPTLDYGNVVD